MIESVDSARTNNNLKTARPATSHRHGIGPSGEINRGYANYMIDMTILVAGLISGVTGIVKWPGMVYSMGLSYRSLPMDFLSTIHDWAGIITFILAFVHVALHRKWLAAMTRKIFISKGGGKK